MNPNLPASEPAQSLAQARAEMFSFGEPAAVLDRRELLDYVECLNAGKWYEPPLPWDGLARSFRAAVHHSSPIYVKRNILVSTFVPHRLLSRSAFTRLVQDYLVFATPTWNGGATCSAARWRWSRR